MHTTNQKTIKFPIRSTPTSFGESASLAATPNYREIRIDNATLIEECRKVINEHQYRLQLPAAGTIILGRDVIACISNITEDDLLQCVYNDMSGTVKFQDYGVILDGKIQGATIIATPARETKSRELTDRERLSSAHIEAVAKLTANKGLAQRGEYRDGWMACIRVLCQNLGVTAPAIIPFKGMRIEDLSEKIIEEMHR